MPKALYLYMVQPKESVCIGTKIVYQIYPRESLSMLHSRQHPSKIVLKDAATTMKFKATNMHVETFKCLLEAW